MMQGSGWKTGIFKQTKCVVSQLTMDIKRHYSARIEGKMDVQSLVSIPGFTLLNQGNMNREIQSPFCCDLLSVAMSKAPVNAAWVTIMGNINTIAVVTLIEASCLILAEGAKLDEPALERAKIEQITIFTTDMPIFEAALLVYQAIHDSNSI